MNWWNSIISLGLSNGATERCARFLPLRVQYKAAKKCVEASGFLLTSKALDQVLDSIQSYFVFVSHSSFWTIIITSIFLIIKYLANSFSSLFIINSLLPVFRKLLLIHFHRDVYISIIATWKFCILFPFLFLGMLLTYFTHSQLFYSPRSNSVLELITNSFIFRTSANSIVSNTWWLIVIIKNMMTNSRSGFFGLQIQRQYWYQNLFCLLFLGLF